MTNNQNDGMDQQTLENLKRFVASTQPENQSEPKAEAPKPQAQSKGEYHSSSGKNYSVSINPDGTLGPIAGAPGVKKKEEIAPQFIPATEGKLEAPNSQEFFKERSAPTSDNPLSKYFRAPALYVKLPSNGRFNKASDIEFTANGEVGVLPMTAADELVFKSPDALMNGAALEQVISSCVPSVKNVRALTTPDFEVLLVAIRCATYGEEMSFSSKCAKCNTENEFNLYLPTLLESTNQVDPDTTVTTVHGLKITLSPYDFDSNIKTAIVAFEEAKVIQTITREKIPDHEKLIAINESYKRVSKLNNELFAAAIQNIKLPDGTVIENKNHIKEWVSNTSKKDYELIEKTLKNLNTGVVPKTVEITCENQSCKHQYTSNVSFDPSHFFG